MEYMELTEQFSITHFQNTNAFKFEFSNENRNGKSYNYQKIKLQRSSNALFVFFCTNKLERLHYTSILFFELAFINHREDIVTFDRDNFCSP